MEDLKERVNNIAIKYVHGNHNALTDRQEVLDMTVDIANLLQYQSGNHEREVKYINSVYALSSKQINQEHKVSLLQLQEENEKLREGIKRIALHVDNMIAPSDKEITNLVIKIKQLLKNK